MCGLASDSVKIYMNFSKNLEINLFQYMTAYTFVSNACKYVVSVVNICFIVALRNLLLFTDPVHDDLMHSSPD